MKPHLILEGPDCSGKTTIARWLVDKHGYTYHHEGPPPADLNAEGLLNHYGGQLAALARARGPHVFDRHWRGELVYGPVLRGGSRLGPEHAVLLERLCRARGVVQALCGPASIRLSLEAWRARRGVELIGEEETFIKIWKLWQDTPHDVRLTDLPPLPRHALERDPVVLPEGYAGNPLGTFLFVGERSNGPLDLPFFSTTGSSGFLRGCLQQAGYQELELAFTNALDLEGRPRKVWPFPVIVALGEVAQDVCVKQGLHGHAVRHPQYWKRFHAREAQAYINTLRRIRDDHLARGRNALSPADPARPQGQLGPAPGAGDDRAAERAPAAGRPKKQRARKPGA